MARSVKTGTSLAASGLVPDHAARQLRALSVTTIDELVGLLDADPDALAAFTELGDLSELRRRAAGPLRREPTATAAPAAARERPGLGALAPPGTLVEDRALASTFEGYRDRVLAATPEQDGVRVDLRSMFLAVRDQGRRGTCVGHACAAVTEAVYARSKGRRINLSPQFVFRQAKQRDGSPNQDGTWAEVAMPTIVDVGTCSERYWPYEPDVRPGDLTHGAPSARAVRNARLHKLAKSIAMSARASSAIRDELDGGHPVEISIPVYRNWIDNPTTRLTGLIPMPLPASSLAGGHAMCVVGYGYDQDVAGGWYFILRNSWGAIWAPDSPIAPGHGVLPFLYVDTYGWEAVGAR